MIDTYYQPGHNSISNFLQVTNENHEIQQWAKNNEESIHIHTNFCFVQLWIHTMLKLLRNFPIVFKKNLDIFASLLKIIFCYIKSLGCDIDVNNFSVRKLKAFWVGQLNTFRFHFCFLVLVFPPFCLAGY